MAAPKGNNYYLLGLDKAGRPPKYANASDLERKIIEYFDYVNEAKENITICGLALYVGFCERRQLYVYAEKSEEFFQVIKRALLIVEKHYENRLSGTTPAGAIFALKNMEWTDKTQIDHTNAGSPFNTLSDDELISRINKLITSGEKGGVG